MSTNGSSVSVNGTDGARHEITVALVTAGEDDQGEPLRAYAITDAEGVLAVDDRCSQQGSTTATCPAAAVGAIGVVVGNADDAVTIAGSVPADIRTDIDGRSGDDLLRGGPGADDIDGAGGNDELYGGPGNDALAGRNGTDTLDGGPGGDELIGGGGLRDTVTYADRTSPIRVSIGAGGRDDGGAEDASPQGMDTVASDVEQVIGGAGPDLMQGDGSDNVLSGGPGADYLFGAAGEDTLIGGPDSDHLYGGPQADLLNGGPAADLFKGGSGTDLVKARDFARDIAIDCGGGRDDRAKRDRADPRGRRCELPRRHKKRHKRNRSRRD